MRVVQQDVGLSTVITRIEAAGKCTGERERPLIISCFVMQSEVKLRSSFDGGLKRNDWTALPRRGDFANLDPFPLALLKSDLWI